MAKKGMKRERPDLAGYISIEDASKLLIASTSSVRKWMQDGKIAGVKHVGKWYILREGLEKSGFWPPAPRE